MTLDQEIAARYLEGSLDMAQASQFEGEFLGHQELRHYLEEAGLLERYLRGELTGPQLDAVEKAIIADPELLEEVDSVAAVERGVAGLPAGSEAATSTRKPQAASIFVSPQYAAAASFVAAALLFVSGYLLVDNQGLRTELDSGSQSLVFDRVAWDVVAVRSTNGVQLSISDSNGFTGLDFDAEIPVNGSLVLYDEYRATVTRTETGAAVVILDNVDAQLYYDDLVTVWLPNRQLVAGNYRVDLSARMIDGPDDQDFEIVRSVEFEVVVPD